MVNNNKLKCVQFTGDNYIEVREFLGTDYHVEVVSEPSKGVRLYIYNENIQEGFFVNMDDVIKLDKNRAFKNLIF